MMMLNRMYKPVWNVDDSFETKFILKVFNSSFIFIKILTIETFPITL